MSERLDQLIEHGDIDAFVGFIDALCLDGDWDQLRETRDRCKAALARGKQLWGVAAHAEYRLALQAPGEYAASVVEPGSGRFSFGPLPEVVASTHAWAEVADYLPGGPLVGVTAHERVLRGEDLTGESIEQARVFELPLVLQSFEPTYPAAHYEPDMATFDAPPLPELETALLPPQGRYRVVDDPETLRPLVALADGWVTESNGHAEAVAVTGGPVDAVAALGLRTAAMAEISFADALAHMAWAGASGGAHGRRKGMATGRFGAWWATVALLDLLDEWPVAPRELEVAAKRLSWWAWGTNEPVTGWQLRLAIHDTEENLSWVLNASDSASV